MGSTSRIGRACIGVGLCIAAVISTAGVAAATDINAWQCNNNPGGTGAFCYDLASDRYKDWDAVASGTQYQRDHVCAGSKTLAGNIKQGSSCSVDGTKYWSVNILYPNDPLGRGYGVWVGDGGPIWITGRSFDND